MTTNKSTEAVSNLRAEGGTPLSALEASIPKFTLVGNLSHFKAEYATDGEDITVHYFLPDTCPPNAVKQYWRNVFPETLSKVAMEYFKAEPPRLVASFTPELNSWWMRARGYGHILDIDTYMQSFFIKLNIALGEAQY